LGITGVLTILDAARIPLHASERGVGDPSLSWGGPVFPLPGPLNPLSTPSG
jgi:hypothetical protein